MTLANDGVLISPDASGANMATHLVGGKEHQVVIPAKADGHLEGSMQDFGFVVPPAAVAAGKIYFDLFNAQAGAVMRLRKLFAIVATDVAVTGLVGVRLDAMRTSAIGSGGTTFASGSASKTAAAFWKFDPGAAALPAGITGRAGATAGATDEAWLFPAYVFTEETNMSSHMPQFFNLLPEADGMPIRIPQNFGLKVVQGAVASVGSIGFLGAFSLE